jgi:nickel/cobalt exporter
VLISGARFVLGLVLCLCPLSSLVAHELTAGVGTQTTFRLFTDRIEIELNLGFSASAGWPVLLALDTDLDDRISKEEAQALLDERGPALLALLDIRVNGRKLEPKIVSSEEVGTRGRIAVRPFDTYYQLVAPLPAELPDGGWWLHFHDQSFEGETSSQFTWIPYEGHGKMITPQIVHPSQYFDEGFGFRAIGRELVVFWDDTFRGEIVPGEYAIPSVESLAALSLPGGDEPENGGEAPDVQTPEAGSSEATPRTTGAPSLSGGEDRERGEEERIGEIVQAIASGDARGWELVLTFLLAMAFGAGHALGPGHGKSMVAAYLVGTRGRVRDAITLGTVVTFAHTFSIFLLGLLLLYLIEQSADKASGATYQNWLTTGFSMLSGLLLLSFGLLLLRRRLRVARGKAEPHGHHDHDHRHRWWGHSHPQLGGEHGHSHGDSHEHSHKPSEEHSHEHDHEHAHSHGHDHEHSHEHPHSHAAESVSEVENGEADGAIGSKVRFGDLVVLGLSGGIVPCPAGFTIMMVAAKYQALGLGLLILAFFSFGLGLLLCTIGVTLVLGKEKLLDRMGSKSQLLMRWLPVLSAGLVASIGIYFMWDSYSRGRTEIGQMLKALGESIAG